MSEMLRRALQARRIIIAAAVIIPVLGIATFIHSAKRVTSAISSDPIFASSFKDFDRKLQPLAQWRGKVTLVYFWATWCKPCRTEVPALIAFYDKYRNRDLAIVGIAIDQTDRVRRFAEEYKINYPVLIGGNDALDLARRMGNGIGGLPFLVVIDRKGSLVSTQLGQFADGLLERVVAPLLS